MKALSLFSGIGGLDLAAEAAVIEIAAMCEIEPFAVQILNKRWPGVPVIDDVRKIRGEEYAGTIDVVFGGFPCQDLSVAGKQTGLEGARSGLWYEMLRIIMEIRPRFVLAENVRGAVNLALDTVVDGMERAGYEVWPFVVPASAFGAPHRRERLFAVGIREDVADSYREGLQRRECGELRERSGKRSAGAVGSSLEDAGRFDGQGRDIRRDIPEAGNGGLASDAELSGSPCGEDEMRLWLTPRRSCANGSGRHGKGAQDIQTACSGAGGQLNPDWVEELMGFPEGWTNPDVDEPQPWRGWPAPMGMELWKTPTVSNAAARQFYHNSKGEMELSGQVQVADLRNWATPNCMDSLPSRSYEAMKRQATTGGRKNRKRPSNLREQIDPEMCEAYREASRENGGGVQKAGVSDQYPYEFPRTVKGGKNRAARLKCLGNAVVPQQAYPFFEAIAEIERMVKE